MQNTSWLYFANISKDSITQSDADLFIQLAKINPRIKNIEQTAETNMFNVASDELIGTYSMGRIAASLNESEKDRNERISKGVTLEPDIINIVNFSPVSKKLSRNSINRLHKYAATLEPSEVKAQCFTIAGYSFEPNETIAQCFLRDHSNESSAKKAAYLMVYAGCANETNRIKNRFGFITGLIVFEDGSTL